MFQVFRNDETCYATYPVHKISKYFLKEDNEDTVRSAVSAIVQGMGTSRLSVISLLHHNNVFMTSIIKQDHINPVLTFQVPRKIADFHF